MGTGAGCGGIFGEHASGPDLPLLFRNRAIVFLNLTNVDGEAFNKRRLPGEGFCRFLLKRLSRAIKPLAEVDLSRFDVYFWKTGPLKPQRAPPLELKLSASRWERATEGHMTKQFQGPGSTFWAYESGSV